MIDNEWKHKYNVLIAYERKVRLKETSDGSFQQQHFYRDAKRRNVCSSRTYCAMEKDEVCGEDAVYVFAAQKLHKEIKNMKSMDVLLQTMIDNLFHHIERLEEEEAAAFLEKALLKMKRCEGVLYYEEFLWQFDMMKHYYQDINFMPSADQFERICATFQIFPDDYQAILMRFAYLYANTNEMEKTKRVFSIYDFGNSTLINNQISCIVYDYLNKHFLNALKRSLRLENKLRKQSNPAQLLTLYCHIFTMIDEFDADAANEYIEKAVALSEKTPFHTNRLLMLYGNAGTTYLKLRFYDKAILFLKKACETSNTTSMRNCLCIAHCYHMLDEEVPHKYLRISLEFGDEVDTCVYAYFQDYENRTIEENNFFIMNKVARNLLPCDHLYLQILMDELYRMASKSNRFKTYYSFRRKFNL